LNTCKDKLYEEVLAKLEALQEQNDLIISEIAYINRGVFGKDPTNTRETEYRKV